MLAGRSAETFDVNVRWEGFYDAQEDELHQGLQDRERIPVESAETCPTDSEKIQLVVTEGPPAPPSR